LLRKSVGQLSTILGDYQRRGGIAIFGSSRLHISARSCLGPVVTFKATLPVRRNAGSFSKLNRERSFTVSHLKRASTLRH
jgi:hypothetical protein